MRLRGKHSHAYGYERTTKVTARREMSRLMTVTQAHVCWRTKASIQDPSAPLPPPRAASAGWLLSKSWFLQDHCLLQLPPPPKKDSERPKRGACVSLGDPSGKGPDVLLAVLSGQQRKVFSLGCAVSFLASASLETKLNSLLSLSRYIFHNSSCAIHSWIDELSGLCASVKQRHLTWKSFLQGNRPIWAKSKQD